MLFEHLNTDLTKSSVFHLTHSFLPRLHLLLLLSLVRPPMVHGTGVGPYDEREPPNTGKSCQRQRLEARHAGGLVVVKPSSRGDDVGAAQFSVLPPLLHNWPSAECRPIPHIAWLATAILDAYQTYKYIHTYTHTGQQDLAEGRSSMTKVSRLIDSLKCI